MRERQQPEQEKGDAKQARRTAGPDAGVDRLPAMLLRLQRSIGNAAVAQLLGGRRPRSTVRDVLRAPGQPLAESTRKDMEARFGADFSQVRLHTDAAARQSATELGARAYTSGHHIVVGPGGIDQHTMAHELTHVVQQRSGPVAGTDHGDGLRVSDPGDRFEREAETTATRVLREPVPEHGPIGTRRSTRASGIQRIDVGQTLRRMVAPRLSLPPLFDGPPDYTAAGHAWAGGRDSRAVLSPTATGHADSNANSSLPRAIRDARRRYPRAGFKAGHLLNGEFGGSGQDARNLTILTTRANNAHKRFDNRVKDALRDLWSIYDLLRQRGIDVSDASRFDLGIRVQVQTTGGTWGPDYPDNCIANGLHCVAAAQGGLGLTNEEQALLSQADQQAIRNWRIRLDGALNQANASGQIDNSRRPTDSNPVRARRGRGRGRAAVAASQSQ